MFSFYRGKKLKSSVQVKRVYAKKEFFLKICQENRNKVQRQISKSLSKLDPFYGIDCIAGLTNLTTNGF